MGKLYLIPTPIGENASWDITLPAGNRRLLDEIGYFVVENTRTARRFLARSGLRRPIDELVFTELNEHTPPEAVAPMLEPLLERGENIGVMSEAGLPCIADPGALLVAAAHRHGQSFAFNGYLPVKAPERQRAIRRFERRAHEERQTQIFIEAPYRNRKLFDDLLAVCSAETHLCVACDLAEPDQYVRSQRIAEWKKSGAPLFEKRPAIFILF